MNFMQFIKRIFNWSQRRYMRKMESAGRLERPLAFNMYVFNSPKVYGNSKEIQR